MINNLKTRDERQKFYQSRDWRLMREYVLQNEPLCRECKRRGIIKLAKIVDHIIDMKDKPELALDPHNLQPLCDDCHNIKGNMFIKKPGEDLMNKIWNIDLPKEIT